MRARHRAWFMALVATSALVPASAAVAGGFGNRLQSAVGTGAAFAGAGTESYGLSGMFWNPAAVNYADGFMYQSSWTFVAPQSEMHASPIGFGAFLPPDSGDIGIDALVPGSYAAYRINPQWAVGLSVNAPFGLATKPDTPWAGQFYAITAKATVIEVAAMLGYTLNDWVNVAIGPRVVYASAKFSRALTLSGQTRATLDGLEDVSYGWQAGLTLKPWAGGEIGLGYRSRVDLNLDGDLIAPGVRLPVEGDVTLPDQATLSLAQKIAPQWTLLGTVEWKNWSLVQDVPFRTDAGFAPTTLTFRYKDGWNFALGAEYQWNDALTLRGGVSYEVSPVQDEDRDVSIPDDDRFWVSAGATYAITDRWQVDLGYSHAFMQDASIRYVAGHPDYLGPGRELIANSENSIDVVSVGFRYRFGGTPTAALPESPIVTK
jgi:long-chain fatty acid transport protein